MDCRDFLRSASSDERERVAKRAGTSVAYLKQIAGGYSKPSAAMAVRLEVASDRRMLREDLLPEFFVRDSVAIDGGSAACR
jgi:transcriptional regulator with XRE-family HTH domain